MAGAGIACAATLVLTQPAFAEEAEPALTPEAVQDALNNIWVLVAAILVIFMQAGFAFVEAGLTRAKNVANIFMKNLSDFLMGGLAFAAVGYAIAFGSGNDFFGTNGWFLDFEGSGYEPAVLPTTFFVFQVAFAATAATIVSGAMAERTKFVSYLIYSFFISALIYPVVVHWVWGGGWLSKLETPFIDFAGSSVVHMTGGLAALVGAAILGPRLGKYTKDGKPRAIPGHSIPFAITGVFILLIGWFGFNPGSQLAADEVVPFVALNTLLAACAGGVIATIVVWLKTGKPDVAMAGNGVLAGLVAITAGCAVMNHFWATVTGAIGGLVVVFAVFGIDRAKVDDPVGAVSVHGVCGALGTILIGFFGTEVGLLDGGGPDQLITQVIGVLAIAAWVVPTAAILFFALKATVGLRVSPEEEIEGLDVHEHGYPGYGEDVVAGDVSGLLAEAKASTS